MQVINSPNVLVPAKASSSEQKLDQKQTQQAPAVEAPSAQQRETLPMQELFRAGELRQIERLEALDRSENLSLKSKDALQQYQATEQAGQSYAGGELLGIDIYV